MMSEAENMLRLLGEADFDAEDMELLRRRSNPEEVNKVHIPSDTPRLRYPTGKRTPPWNGKVAVLYFSRSQGEPCLDDLYTGKVKLEPGTKVVVPADGGPVGATEGIFISQSPQYVGIAWYDTDIPPEEQHKYGG